MSHQVHCTIRYESNCQQQQDSSVDVETIRQQTDQTILTICNLLIKFRTLSYELRVSDQYSAANGKVLDRILNRKDNTFVRTRLTG